MTLTFFEVLATVGVIMANVGVLYSSEMERERMVYEQLELRDINSFNVLEVMRSVPRDQFIPESLRSIAYNDYPLSIGYSQTISQPYIVAFMSQAADINRGDRCLEIGTGSGYQTAILSKLCKEVYTIEIIPELSIRAQKIIDKLDYRNVQFKIGDGYEGWPMYAPYNVIIVTAAPPFLPRPLVDQLESGGRMIIPVGRGEQHLLKIFKNGKMVEREYLLPVQFVPMTGAVEKIESKK